MAQEQNRTNTSPNQSRSQGQSDGKINLNRASRQELAQVSSIGEELAGRIVQRREEQGGFKNWKDVDELFQISGTRVDKLREEATL